MRVRVIGVGEEWRGKVWLTHLLCARQQLEVFDVVHATRPHAGRHALLVAHAHARLGLDQQLSRDNKQTHTLHVCAIHRVSAAAVAVTAREINGI